MSVVHLCTTKLLDRPLPVAPVCPIAINPIMRSGAGGLTRHLWRYDNNIGVETNISTSVFHWSKIRSYGMSSFISSVGSEYEAHSMNKSAFKCASCVTLQIDIFTSLFYPISWFYK
jgi:hypothetical protein